VAIPDRVGIAKLAKAVEVYREFCRRHPVGRISPSPPQLTIHQGERDRVPCNVNAKTFDPDGQPSGFCV